MSKNKVSSVGMTIQVERERHLGCTEIIFWRAQEVYEVDILIPLDIFEFTKDIGL